MKLVIILTYNEENSANNERINDIADMIMNISFFGMLFGIALSLKSTTKSTEENKRLLLSARDGVFLRES